MQAQDFAAATALLQDITTRDPENARAWILLGTAQRSSGAMDQAIESFTRATAFSQTKGQALYGIGIVYALKEDKDAAFNWLKQAQATGTVNMASLKKLITRHPE